MSAPVLGVGARAREAEALRARVAALTHALDALQRDYVSAATAAQEAEGTVSQLRAAAAAGEGALLEMAAAAAAAAAREEDRIRAVAEARAAESLARSAAARARATADGYAARLAVSERERARLEAALGGVLGGGDARARLEAARGGKGEARGAAPLPHRRSGGLPSPVSLPPPPQQLRSGGRARHAGDEGSPSSSYNGSVGEDSGDAGVEAALGALGVACVEI